MSEHIQHMQSALNLARQGLGRTSPNPTVGCVIVKDGSVTARARTADGGRPHAEFLALKQAGSSAKNATAYVTLEPCAHEGQTPSCARIFIEAGIQKCVIAAQDIDPRTKGQGVSMLREAGIDVVEGVLEQEAYDLNKGFFLRHTENRPFISLKIATSLDGKIADRDGHSKWITNELSRRRAHLIRAQHDAIAVGVNTVLKDNPLLTTRLEGVDHKMTRIIFDTNLRLTGNEKIFEDTKNNPVWILTASDKKIKNATMIKTNLYDLKSVMAKLAQRGVTRLMIEGGSQLISSFFHAGLYDQFYWFKAPQKIGANGLNAIENYNICDLYQKRDFIKMSIELNEDSLVVLDKK